VRTAQNRRNAAVLENRVRTAEPQQNRSRTAEEDQKYEPTHQHRLQPSCPLLYDLHVHPGHRPSYPADEYHPASDSYEAEYYYNGDAYLAKRFWSITDYVFGGGSQVARVVISLTQAMLVVRAWLIVSGQAERKKEMAAGVVTLGMVGYFLVKMMISMWSCRWPVLIVMVLLMVTSIVMSRFVEHTATGYFANRTGKQNDNGRKGG